MKKALFQMWVDETGKLDTNMEWNFKGLTDTQKTEIIMAFANGLGALQQAELVQKVRYDMAAFATLNRAKPVYIVMSDAMDKSLIHYMKKTAEGMMSSPEIDGDAPLFNAYQAFNFSGQTNKEGDE